MSKTTLDHMEPSQPHVVLDRRMLESLVTVCGKPVGVGSAEWGSVKTAGESRSHVPNEAEEVIWELFLELVQERSKAKFLRLRELIIEYGNYTPYVGLIDKMETLFTLDDHRRVVRLYKQSWPNCILSPRAHLILSRIYDKFGTSDHYRYEEAVGFTVLDLIMNSGDGSRERPYIILHLADENDVLAALERQKIGEELMEIEGRYLDCVMTTDGEEIYFDVTDMILRGKDIDEEEQFAAIN